MRGTAKEMRWYILFATAAAAWAADAPDNSNLPLAPPKGAVIQGEMQVRRSDLFWSEIRLRNPLFFPFCKNRQCPLWNRGKKLPARIPEGGQDFQKGTPRRLTAPSQSMWNLNRHKEIPK
jgi:hypothetical protein